MIKVKNRYIGLKKIKEARLLERKTLFGKDAYEVIFVDGTSKEYPEEMLEYIVTTKAIDASKLQERTVKPIVEKIMAIFIEAEISLVDMNYINSFVSPQTIGTNLDIAKSYMWGKDVSEVTYKDVEDKLKEKNGGKE